MGVLASRLCRHFGSSIQFLSKLFDTASIKALSFFFFFAFLSLKIKLSELSPLPRRNILTYLLHFFHF